MRTLTIRLDDDLYAWLMKFHGWNSFTVDANETIVTSLRCLRGDLPLAMLAPIAAAARGVSGAEVLFGKCADEAKTIRLLDAAAEAARGRHAGTPSLTAHDADL
jgi:hypothetical protein